ncbi:MAG: prolyl-tRNA synthetase associated domain-containing protein [Clostridia bacterium]|nr:prolyl-tRNA synthetase associated domain-containing protein [Clostridia bacterium]
MNRVETLALLDACGFVYEVTEHSAVYTMLEAAQYPMPYPEADAKNLFLKDDRAHFYMLTVQGDRHVDLKRFRKAQGLRNLRFASEDDMAQVLQLHPGAVTPLGLLNDAEHCVILYLDDALGDTIGVHPNDNTATVWMRTEDLITMLQAHGTRVIRVPIPETERKE